MLGLKRRVQKRKEALAAAGINISGKASTPYRTNPLPRKTVQKSLSDIWPKIKQNALPALGVLFFLIVLSATVVLAVHYGVPIILRRAYSALKYLFNDKPERRIMAVHKNLTYDIFSNQYSNLLPVLFRSTMAQETRDDIMSLLKNDYGDLPIEIGHVSSLTIGGSAENADEMKLQDYISTAKFSKQNPGYVFDSNLLLKMPLIKDLLVKPSLPVNAAAVYTEKGYVSPFSSFDSNVIFSIGKKDSGLALHQHRQSYNELIHGEKHWTLYPPSKVPTAGFNPWETHLEWIDSVLPKLEYQDLPLEVIQHEGEVLYIPEGWYHATVAESELTVSVTQQTQEANPGTAYQIALLGTSAYTRKDYATAIEHFTSSIVLVDNANIRRSLGECYEKLGNQTAAEFEYRKAISLNRRHPAAYVELIGMMLDSGRIDEARTGLVIAEKRGVKHRVLDQYRIKLMSTAKTTS